MARGQVFDNGAVRLEVTVTGADSEGALYEMRARYAPDSPLPPAHLHPAQEETFTVVAGELHFLVDGEERTVPAGERIVIGPGAVHQVRNAGAVACEAIWQTRPALRSGEFFEAMSNAIAAQDWDTLGRVLQDYPDVFCLAEHP